MGVDGIGSGGGRPLGAVGPAAPSGVAGTDGLEAGRPASAEGPSGSAALEQLQRGEIDLEHYLDTRVVEATRHLEGRLAPSELDFIRAALRGELEADPVLGELVRRTTGALPPRRAE